VSPHRAGSRIPLLGRNAAAQRLVRERTWLLEQRIAELERERQDLGRILRGLGEGVVAVDRAGVVVHANPAAIRMLGLDGSSCIGNHMFVAIPHPGVCDVLEEVMRGSPKLVREVPIERPEGDTVLSVSVRSLRKADDEDGEAEGAIAVVRDVTDLRRLERARQDFFGNVSHELKTPVTAIRGAVETILDDPGMSEPDRIRFLDGARRHAMRLGSLVTDLLALARLEAGPRALQVGEVDLAALAGEVLAAAEGSATSRQVRLELAADGVADAHAAPALTVDGDEEALRQAIANLVDNAVAHSEAGGRVRVALAVEAGVVSLTVQDEGAGIPPEALERVFERFYRVDEARSRARGGTGIGLSIVKHVAQAHGGSVGVSSELGAGSTFELRLPVSHDAVRGTHSPT
jgi:two-component system phosphate regulon sensor histidine kinase PhoR